MPFDPSKPFQVESSPEASPGAPGFDPSLDFEIERARPSPIAEQEAFKRGLTSQPVQSRGQQALSALINPMGTAYQMGKNLVNLGIEGVRGIGTIGAEENVLGSANQTVAEVVPRQAYHIADIIRQAAANPAQASRALNAQFNPIGSALGRLISPQGAVTPEQAQRDYEQQLVNEAYQQQAAQPIAEFGQRYVGLVPTGKTNIPTAEAIPLALGAENLPGAIKNLVQSVGTQGARTAATIGAVPLGTLPQASKIAEPYLSGSKLAGAKTAFEAATENQASLQRIIEQGAIKDAAAETEAALGIAKTRGEAATKGREALSAGRELKTAQGTITPEIVQSTASIEEAAQMPAVILGRTAEERAVFGSKKISEIEREIKVSDEIYTKKYTALEKSLPEVQPKVEAQPLFDAASKADVQLSQGFEAYNKGKIRQMIDESTRLDEIKGGVDMVPAGIRKLYEAEKATPTAKADLLRAYPGLAEPVSQASTTIPKYTWSELQARLRNVNEGITQALKHGDVNDARILGDLKDGVIKSMDNYSSVMGPEAQNMLKDANKAYAAHQEKFGLNRIQTLFKDDVLQNPEYVAQKLITYDNPSQVNAIKAIVTPEEFVPVQAQFSKKFFSPVDEVAFDPAHFVKEFNKEGARETVKAVFGQEGLNNFKKIYDASQSFSKIGELQKTLDTLATQSESATKSFSTARKGVSEAESLLARKNALKAQLKPTQEAAEAAKLKAASDTVKAAARDLDRVKNYSDLKDWATRVSGLNILQSAATSPAWIELSRYQAIHMDQFAKPAPERTRR